MRKPHLPEQLFGLAGLLLILMGLAAGFFALNRGDFAREYTIEKRERMREVQDSIEQAIEAKAQQREEWELQKAEREQKRKEWQQKHAEWEAYKLQREADKRPIDSCLIQLHPFNPNLADSMELLQLGFPPRTAHSLIRYRLHGGRFRKADDVRKIHFINDTLFAAIEPYILIVSDSLPQNTYVSRKRDTVLNVNSADTAELQMLRGIGAYTAVQIVRYRERLGGFYSLNQLREVPNIRYVDSIMPHLWVDTLLVKPLYINRLSVEVMNRHPYIRFEQARVLRDRRHRKGPFRSVNDLAELKDKGEYVFTKEEIERLQPYLRFDK